MNSLITVLIIVIVLIILYKTQNKMEGFSHKSNEFANKTEGFMSLNQAVDWFDDSKNPEISYYYQWGPPIRSTIHATLAKGNKVTRFDFKPPAYRGVYGCTQTRCPDSLDPDIVCWCCCNFH